MGDGRNVNAQRAIVAFVCGALFGGAWPPVILAYGIPHEFAEGIGTLQNAIMGKPPSPPKKIGLHSYLKLQE